MKSKQIKISLLIEEARMRLDGGNDPLHDSRHAARVAEYAKNIAKQTSITDSRHLEALLISAWWHDVSRTITKTPSFVLMPLLDDTLSAIMLAITIVKRGAFTRSSLLAWRLVLSKSIATGKIFSRVFLSKQMRVLLDILQDADTVDTLARERTEMIQEIIGSSKNYERGYQLMTWWFTSTTFLHVKTDAAKKQLQTVLQEFFSWLMQLHIKDWHIERYGKEWFDELVQKLRVFMYDIQMQLSHTLV